MCHSEMAQNASMTVISLLLPRADAGLEEQRGLPVVPVLLVVEADDEGVGDAAGIDRDGLASLPRVAAFHDLHERLSQMSRSNKILHLD